MIGELLILICTLLGFVVYKLRQRQQHWQKLGVPVPPVYFPLGNNPVINMDIMWRRLNAIEVALRQSRQMKEHKFYGIYTFHTPSIVFRDAELIRRVTITDFSHFTDRLSHSFGKTLGVGGETDGDLMWAKGMAMLSGDEWREVRSTFSPIFTSGKLKAMYRLLQDVGKQLLASFEQAASSKTEIDLHNVFMKFSLHTLASCAFGLDPQALADPNSEFEVTVSSIFQRGWWDYIKTMVILLPGVRRLCNVLNIDMIKPKQTRYLRNVLLQSLRKREKQGWRRNDLIDLMVDAVEAESSSKKPNGTSSGAGGGPNQRKKLNETTLLANAFILLSAGFDSTAHTMTHCAYHLTKNPDMQSRLQDEIDEAAKDSNEDFPDYQKLLKMEYLDMVVHETLRVNSPAAVTLRVCTKDYTIPGTRIEIKEGTDVFLNLVGVHMDPDVFPEPERFDPERFNQENRAESMNAFFGFGQGPRNCVGSRFALLEIKLALFAILRKYNLVASEYTPKELQMDPRSVTAVHRGKLLINVTKRHV